jgi:hypothetical protein
MEDNIYSNAVQFDTDSFPVKIDNCCTQTMSGFKNDFILASMIPVHGKHVVGFAHTKTVISHKGTVKWNITDDNGVHHDICIPNAYYVPGCDIRLLLPQHWSQESNDTTPNRDGTWCATYKDRVVLQWSQLGYKKTIPIDPEHGTVATMWTSGGSTKYKELCQIVQNATMMYDAEVNDSLKTASVDENIYKPS